MQPFTTRMVQVTLCLVSFLTVCFLFIKSKWNCNTGESNTGESDTDESINTTLHVSCLLLLMIVYAYLTGTRDVDAFYLVIGLTVSLLVHGAQFSDQTSWITICITGLLLALLIYVLLRTYVSRINQKDSYQRTYPMYPSYKKSILWLFIVFIVWMILIGFYFIYKNKIHPYVHDIISCIMYQLVTIGALLTTIR